MLQSNQIEPETQQLHSSASFGISSLSLSLSKKPKTTFSDKQSIPKNTLPFQPITISFFATQIISPFLSFHTPPHTFPLYFLPQNNMQSFTSFRACLSFYSSSLLLLLFLLLLLPFSHAGLLSQPVEPGEYPSSNTVPAFPVQTQAQNCRLDLSNELFGGVKAACGKNLDRSRCCPVLAAWLFAAHARTALEISTTAPAPASGDLPMMPDDSQKCVNSLQDSLQSRNIRIPQPNATCDAILCFCGIRLHQISSLSCPAAFNVSAPHKNATPTAAVRNLENNCRNASYSGCTKCLSTLQKVKGFKNETKEKGGSERIKKMFSRDCQLMGLTWLLAKNKTAYIPTVSAVLRAMMYSAHPHESKCSPDQENMPLAVDSLQFESGYATSWPSKFWVTFLPLIILVFSFV